MKINNNLFKSNKSGAAKGMMLGAATGGVIGAAAGGTIGLYVGNEVAKKTSLEKIANEMRITIVDDHTPDVISDKEILEKGGAIWYKKDNLIFTVGDDPRGFLCDPKTLDNCYVYNFTPEDFFRDYEEKLKNYSIKGMLVGALTGTFIGALVGAFTGILLGSDEDKGKKG